MEKNEKKMRHEEYILGIPQPPEMMSTMPRTKNLPRPAWSLTNWRRGGGMTRMTVEGRCIPP